MPNQSAWQKMTAKTFAEMDSTLWPHFWYKKCTPHVYDANINMYDMLMPTTQEELAKDCLRFVSTNNTLQIWSFAQVLEQAERVATGLTEKLQVQQGDCVVVRTLSRPSTVICFLALWKIGAIPVLCNVLASATDLANVQQDTQARLLVADVELVNEKIMQPFAQVLLLPNQNGITPTSTTTISFDSLLLCERKKETAQVHAQFPAFVAYTYGVIFFCILNF